MMPLELSLKTPLLFLCLLFSAVAVAQATDDATDNVSGEPDLNYESDVMEQRVDQSFSEDPSAGEPVGEERFAELERLCSSWLRRVERDVGTDVLELAAPLTCLGNALYRLGRYAESISLNERAIRMLERHANAFDPRLVTPLENLGGAMLSIEKFDAAEAMFIRAKDITHRNKGIFSQDQTRIVNGLTAVHLRQANPKSANREQRFLLQISEQAYGNTPPLTPALKRIGRWYDDLGRGDLARQEYRRAYAILEHAYGPNDLRLVGPLRDIANSYMQAPGSTRIMSKEGSKALRHVISLYSAQEFTDQVDLARAYSDLGDWYMRASQRKRAFEAYKNASQILQSYANQTSGQDTPAPSFFNQEVELDFEFKPVSWNRRRNQSLPPGTIEIVFEFTVDASGRVRDIKVIKDEVGVRQLLLTSRANVRASRYRPRIVDGVPIATHNVRKVLKFNFDSQKRESSVNTDNTVQAESGTDTAEEDTQ